MAIKGEVLPASDKYLHLKQLTVLQDTKEDAPYQVDLITQQYIIIDGKPVFVNGFLTEKIPDFEAFLIERMAAAGIAAQDTQAHMDAAKLAADSMDEVQAFYAIQKAVSLIFHANGKFPVTAVE